MNKNEITLLEMIIKYLETGKGDIGIISSLLHNETYRELLEAVPHIHMEMTSAEIDDAIQAIQAMIDSEEE